jgi:PilZ domain
MTPKQTSARPTGSESASTSSPTAPDRRRHPRTACEIDAKVTELADGTPGSNWPAKVVDLSRGGAGLRCQHKATVGIDVLIELRGDGAALGQLLFGTVRHTREAQPGEFSVGVEFRAVPNTPTIRAWQARRRSLR